MGETSRGDGSVLENASLVCAKALVLVVPHLEDAPFVEFYGDLVMGTDTLSTGSTDPIGNESLDLTPASSLLPPPIPLIRMPLLSP